MKRFFYLYDYHSLGGTYVTICALFFTTKNYFVLICPWLKTLYSYDGTLSAEKNLCTVNNKQFFML